MFRTTAPVRVPAGAAGQAPAGVPRVVRAARYAPTGPGAGYRPDAELEAFFRDLGAPYGARFAAERYAAEPRRTSVELAYGALDALGPLSGQDAPQLAVVAYATPDIDHAELVASCVKRRLPGEPLAFGVSDQGVLGPFSALRVAVEYARRCGFHRLLLLTLDQRTQPFDVPREEQDEVRADVAVALLLHWGGGAGAVAGMAHGQPSPRLFDDWDRAVATVTGTGLTGDGPRLPAHTGPRAVAEPGQPCTGPWAALTDTAGPAGRVVVADYDRARDQLALCTLDLGERGADDDSGRAA
ncbi:hypothetical protein [Streptomyces sp. NPDC001480]|uniref:hypothetical protein n=1 Tax=Streptomyces sp. NPDC001480 TaxID=3364577 RepID=UPI0036A06EAB